MFSWPVRPRDRLTGFIYRTDLELRYQPESAFNLALGANNLFDVYPRKVAA